MSTPLISKDAASPAAAAVPDPDLLGVFTARLMSRNKGLSSGVATQAAGAGYIPLHDHLAGCSPHLGGGRSGAMWRDILTAEHPISLEYLFHLASLPMAEPRAAVRAVAAALDRAADPARPAGSLPSRVAALDAAASALSGALLEAQADGSTDAGERAAMLRTLDQVDAFARDVRAWLTGCAR